MKLKIGPFVYTIVREEEVGEENGSPIWGQCTNRTSTIRILSSLPEIQRKHTELHEILHALFFLGGLEPVEEEKIVNTLAPLLMLFMQDNPKYVESLCEKPR